MKMESFFTSAKVDIGQEETALRRAYMIQVRAAQVGFDWPDVEGAWGKVAEELRELRSACQDGMPTMITEELGDALFALVNVARFFKVDPEMALAETNDKFCRRFAYIEEQMQRNGKNFEEVSLQELDAWWEEAKRSFLRQKG